MFVPPPFEGKAEPQEECVAPGQALIFDWNSGHNVLEVSQANHQDCSGITNTTPAQGPFSFVTNTEGVHYFICGVGSHCSAGNMKAKITVSSSC